MEWWRCEWVEASLSLKSTDTAVNAVKFTKKIEINIYIFLTLSGEPKKREFALVLWPSSALKPALFGVSAALSSF